MCKVQTCLLLSLLSSHVFISIELLTVLVMVPSILMLLLLLLSALGFSLLHFLDSFLLFGIPNLSFFVGIFTEERLWLAEVNLNCISSFLESLTECYGLVKFICFILIIDLEDELQLWWVLGNFRPDRVDRNFLSVEPLLQVVHHGGLLSPLVALTATITVKRLE